MSDISASSSATGVPSIIVAGASGQVGSAMVSQLRAAGRTVIPLTRAEVDLSVESAVVSSRFSDFLDANPAPNPVFINAAAWTAVDDAEDSINAETVNRVNAESPAALAGECKRRGIPHVFVSTDYVFGGTPAAEDSGDGPVAVAPTTPPEPVNNYGRTKRAGEQAVLASGGTVVRTAWVFSGGTGPGRDFVDTMRGLADRGIDPAVVADQYGRPTFAGHLAASLVEVADTVASKEKKTQLPTILHATGSGDVTTWCEFARAIFAKTGHDPARVSAIPTVEYPTPAARPTGSYLDISGWQADGLTPLPAWQDGLAEALG